MSPQMPVAGGPKMSVEEHRLTGPAPHAGVSGSERARLPELWPEAELALLARALHTAGYADPAVGHLTYRQPDFLLTLPRELAWDEVRASDVLRIDFDGRKLSGELSVPGAINVHIAVHRLRPDCIVTVHQHPKYSTTYAALGRIPPAYDQRSVAATGAEITFFDDYPAAFTSGKGEAAELAAKTIVTANYTLLRNHGVFVIGDDIPQAFSRAAALEWRCRLAWQVESLGEGLPVPSYGEAAIISSLKSLGEHFPYFWPWAVRQELKADPDILL